MLEIDQSIVNEIAEMKTRHSWALPLMQLGQSAADKAEEKMCQWITRTVTELYPTTYEAERIVRTVWLLLLESPAIERYVNRHPHLHVPVVSDPGSAAYLGAMELMYVADADIKAAKEVLAQMQAGKLKPDLKEIMD